ncbi:hypothetical protein K431DRAFT_285977 [Polychaeton citri CBS 116435]|uniref:R3H domain-containing protein n=1 Tax=Polychaeton citri CBS 116435 TaxID=1314669 RepID=A0A9P4Q8E0_9PEZI|nr:hypothetical protein K431DRAFT_285977 [Polychaeton citri CBS 116435]
MEGSSRADQAQPSHQQSNTQTQRADGRSGRGRNRGRGGRNAALGFRPATVAPNTVPSSADNSGTESGNNNPARKPRQGRPRQHQSVNGRTFGGRLTQQGVPTQQQSASAGQLQGSAPLFVPGQDAPKNALGAESAKPSQRPQRPQRRRPSKSQAPDIATRTHEDINNGHYECPICTSEVQRNSKVWACHSCWTVFHLTCIKKWVKNEGSAAAQQNVQNGDAPPPRQWRCPGCNLPKDVLPNNYTCWCEKEIDPRSTAGIPPHSCGNTCGRERVRKCPHPCQMTCHAGPCPPCTHMGPTQVCYCGKHESTKRCSETDYEHGWSCGEVCGELLPCGEHACPRPCHEGLCGACEIRVPARCYCGQVEKDVLCCDRGDEMISHRQHMQNEKEPLDETWTGSFECSNPCGRPFDCGVHVCKKPCHSQESTPTHCPRSPDIVTHCSCGKTPLGEISDRRREDCTDIIPSCNKPCGKLLQCGHSCSQICHIGECMPCLQVVDINCRCGRTTSKTICHQGVQEPPQCMRPCRANMNCGRHACDERCCTGEKQAVQRQSTRRKQRPLHAAPRALEDGFEPEHICTRQCSRLLTCGSHICTELCHKGPCGACREAIFDEISCHCGRTVLQPPLACGTQPPPCRYPCTRPKACGHPQVAHNCHQDNESCPKCPFLVQKRCMCGKQTIKNQPCWLQDARCGQICGRKLRCGSHHCRKTCHRPGECEDGNGQPCAQPCGKLKKACGHPDESHCHAPYACKEETPCQSKIFITCECQAQKQEMKCMASKSSPGNADKALQCNDECARLERNRRLALALNINPSSHIEASDHIPYSTETIRMFAENTKWAQEQEREFRVFATSDNEKRLRFKPMKPHQRSFVHSLAEDFGFDSESVDPEPHRHVMIWKTPRFVSAPNKTLAECLRIRQAQRSNIGSANVSDTEAPKKTKASNVVGEPYNGFVISNSRFGLTIDELRGELGRAVPIDAPLQFDIEFLPNEDVVLKAISRTLPPHDLDTMLQNLRQPVATAMAAKGFGSVQLCAMDSSLNILRRESDSSAATDGWSRVAAKKAAPKVTASGTSTNMATNAFSALSDGKITFAKKKPTATAKAKRETVVDDWEAAEVEEEEKEKSAVNSGTEEENIVATLKEQKVIPDEASQRQPSESDAQTFDAVGLPGYVDSRAGPA